MNICMFQGRLTAGPQSNQSNVTFSIAVRLNRENSMFISCTVWNTTLAENILRYFKKGDPIIVSGPISVYQSPTGKQQLQLTVNTFDFPLSKPKKSEDVSRETSD